MCNIMVINDMVRVTIRVSIYIYTHTRTHIYYTVYIKGMGLWL